MLRRRLAWMAVGAVTRRAVKRSTRRAVDRETERLAAALPPRVVSALELLPGDLTRTGASLSVAASRMSTTARRTRTIGGSAGRARGRLVSLRSELDTTIERERRRLLAESRRALRGESAAFDALLDLRTSERPPIPPIPAAVARGRRRARPALPAPRVARVQRSYEPPLDEWNRPGNRRRRG